MKKWYHKIDIHAYSLEQKLNRLSREGYEIYKLWRVGFDMYEIIAYKEVEDDPT